MDTSKFHVNTFEVVIALFFISSMQYLCKGVDSAFWNSLFYINIYTLALFSLKEVRDSNKYDKTLIESCMIFATEYLLLMIFLTNKDLITFYDYCTADNFTYVFILSLFVLILVNAFKKK